MSSPADNELQRSVLRQVVLIKMLKLRRIRDRFRPVRRWYW